MAETKNANDTDLGMFFTAAHIKKLPQWVLKYDEIFFALLLEVQTTWYQKSGEVQYNLVMLKQLDLIENIEKFPDSMEEFVTFFKTNYCKDNQEGVILTDKFKRITVSVTVEDLEKIPMCYIAIMMLIDIVIPARNENYVMKFYKHILKGFYYRVLELIENKKAETFGDNIVFFITLNEVVELYIDSGGKKEIYIVLENMYIGNSRKDCVQIKYTSFKSLKSKLEKQT